jgi:hypothetical protein
MPPTTFRQKRIAVVGEVANSLKRLPRLDNQMRFALSNLKRDNGLHRPVMVAPRNKQPNGKPYLPRRFGKVADDDSVTHVGHENLLDN